MRRSLMCLALVMVCAVVHAGFGLPKLPKLPGGDNIPTDKIPVKIPGLDRVLKEKPAISVSLEDANPLVPWLDDIAEVHAGPLTELAYDFDEGWPLVAGGFVEHWAQSYCLDPGLHSPGSGSAYVDARIAGPLAEIVLDVIKNSARHLEIPQSDIQALVWAIVSRAKVSDLSPELQDVARKLLTPEQIKKLNGGSLAKIPEDVREEVFGKLPPLARMALEGQASMRQLLAEHADFSELEDVAVLSGDPPEDKGDADFPAGRWSFDPDGYFVRYFPDGYQTTLIQLYVPEQLEIEADDAGRIVSIADREGNRIEVSYQDDVEPMRVRGDRGTKAHAIGAIRLTRIANGEAETYELRGGWTFVGVPSGTGKLKDEDALAGMRQRYREATRRAKASRALLDRIAKRLGLDRRCRYLASAEEDLADLQNLWDALAAVVNGAGDAPDWAAGHLALVKRAWMSAVALVAQGPGDEDGARMPWYQRMVHMPGGVLRLASTAGLMGLRGWGNAATRIAFRGGGFGRRGRKLPRFGPFGHTALPGRRARQRLAQSARSPSDSPGKRAFNRAKEVLDWASPVQFGVDVVVSGPAQAVGNQVGFAVPNKLMGDIISFDLNAAEEISRQLGGDPPRDDFRQIAVPQTLRLPLLQPIEGVPQKRIDAINAFAQALHDLIAQMRAAQISLDRFGGACEADDEQWADRQAAQVCELKRAVGQAMLEVASRLRALLAELEDEGVSDIAVTPEAVRRFQQRLQTQGWDRVELQAAQMAGLTAEELERVKQKCLSADPDEVAGNLMDRAREIIDAMQELGGYLASMNGRSAFVSP